MIPIFSKPLLKLVVIVCGLAALCSFPITTSDSFANATRTGRISRNQDTVQQWAEKLGANPLPSDVQDNVTEITSLAQASEWLGPLAPIAISPFFGITCLAGISQFGGDYLPLNSFMSTNPVLNTPTVFWVFLGLTILTSVPRFTKVSKPAAQAIDQLEAYAGIITILVIRFLPVFFSETETDPATAWVVQMGVMEVSVDMLLGVAAIINIVVINTVKFFFEIMVWLIPFPFVDAMLEIANKSVCAGLMLIYAYSPLVAMLLNFLLFGICLILYRWINRRVAFMRAMIGDPIWTLVRKNYGHCRHGQLTVFPQESLWGFPAKSKLLMCPTESGWRFLQPRFLRTPRRLDVSRDQFSLDMREGLLINSIEVAGPVAGTLLFSRRYRNQSSELSRLLKIGISSQACADDLKSALAKA